MSLRPDSKPMWIAGYIAKTTIRRWAPLLDHCKDEVRSEALLAAAYACNALPESLWGTYRATWYAYGRLKRGLQAANYLPRRHSGFAGMDAQGWLETDISVRANQPSEGDNEFRLLNKVVSRNGSRVIEEIEVRDMLSLLGKKIADMAWRHWIDGETLAGIGRRYGMTRQGVADALNRSKGRMRDIMKRGGMVA